MTHFKNAMIALLGGAVIIGTGYAVPSHAQDANGPERHETYAAQITDFSRQTGIVLDQRLVTPPPSIEARIASMGDRLTPKPDYAPEYAQNEGSRVAPVVIADGTE